MNIFAQLELPLDLIVFICFAVGACLVVWAVIFKRWLSRTPILQYEPRRRVPWQIWDLLAVVFFYIAVFALLIQLAQYFYFPESNELSRKLSDGQITTAHPLVQLLAVKNWTAFFLCGMAAVVVAPIAEEFLFRILLQGWLEKVDRDWRRRFHVLRRWMPLAAMPIIIASLIFAWPHFREAAPQVDVNYLVLALACDSIAKILTFIFGIAFLHWRVGATAADLGWAPGKILADVRLGLIAFIAVRVPIYAGQIILVKLVPKEYAPDPIPIFFFAIALGLIYNRTHRAAPSIVAHMALNASSLAMFLLWGEG